jgi:hypothetical protein
MISAARSSEAAEIDRRLHVQLAQRSLIDSGRSYEASPEREDHRKADTGAIVKVKAKGFRLDLSTAQWFKSTRSGSNADNCVEVAFVDGAIAVRDSKNPTGTALIFTAAEWDAFVGGAKDGEFDR